MGDLLVRQPDSTRRSRARMMDRPRLRRCILLRILQARRGNMAVARGGVPTDRGQDSSAGSAIIAIGAGFTSPIASIASSKNLRPPATPRLERCGGPGLPLRCLRKFSRTHLRWRNRFLVWKSRPEKQSGEFRNGRLANFFNAWRICSTPWG